MKLTTLPITIDADSIAAGLLDMFDDEERTVLRFGMLPRRHMDRLARAFRSRFLVLAKSPLKGDGDEYIAIVDSDNYPRHFTFSMTKLVNEAVHAVVVAIYRRVDLVV